MFLIRRVLGVCSGLYFWRLPILPAISLLFFIGDAFAKHVNVMPVNNGLTSAMKSGKSRSVSLEDERNLLDSYYQAKGGGIEDEFIPFADSPEFVAGLPNGREQTVTHRDVDKVRAEQLKKSENSQWEQYFIMQKRIIAPTMK